jgi:hypothetical protein
MTRYQISASIDCDKVLETSNLKGETVFGTRGKLTLVQFRQVIGPRYVQYVEVIALVIHRFHFADSRASIV